MDNVKDRIVQYANRYKLTDTTTGEVLGTFDFDEVTGTVTAEGTPINKALFDSIAEDLTANTAAISAVDEKADTHIERTDNPHSVSKEQVGLGNVANERQYSAQNPPPYPVTSVAGKIGAVTLGKGDVGLGSVDNTADKDKPVSTAQAAAIAEAKKAGTDAQATADAHIARTDNPHSVTAAQIGAEPAFNKNSAFNKNFGTESGTVCEGNDGRLQGNVKYTAQSLSEEQQAQVRNNINALSADEADIRYIPVDCDHEFEITGYTGHEWNVAVPDQCQLTVTKIKGQTRRKSLNLANNALFEINNTTMNNSANPIQLTAGDYSIAIQGATFSTGQWQIILNDIVTYTFDLSTVLQAPFSVSTPSSFRIYANNGSPNAKIMLVRGTYTAETMPAYQPFDDTLVNSKVRYVLSTGKNLVKTISKTVQTETGSVNIMALSDGALIIPVNRIQWFFSVAKIDLPAGTYSYYSDLTPYGRTGVVTEPNNVFAPILPTTFTINAPTTIYVNYCSDQDYTSPQNVKFYFMLVYGSTVPTEYQPYISDDTFGVDLEITQFGEVDNLTKQFTEYGSANVITLDGSADEGWFRIQTSSADRWRFNCNFTDYNGEGNGNTVNIKSNWIDVNAHQTWDNITGIGSTSEGVVLCNPAYSTVEELRAWLAANPIQFIYRLATPRIQKSVNIQAGYSAHKGGLQQQVIEGDYLPYILTKNYPISMAAQTASLMEVDRKQSTLINKNTADIAQKATEIAANTEAINKITDGRTTVGNSKKFDEKTSDNFALISGSYSAMSVGYATSAGSASSAETADNANNASKADTAKNYSLDGTIKQKFDSIEERLSSLGFKQGSISLASGFNATQNTVTRQGNYIIGSLSLDGAGKVISGTSGSFNLGTIPSNFRPKTTVRCGVMFNRSSVTQITHGEPLYAIIGTNGTITVYWERAATSNYSSRIYLTGLNFGYEANSL